ncbi:MAG: hypothetical protein COA39_004410 [Sulfurimonas sp.]|nr:hypothetical protein [Sulfurimonas sp.]
MVRKYSLSSRFAFTMIELIFAIVIIAISVISLPMMTQVTNKGIESNIVQETIFAASAVIMGSVAGVWDEKSMQDINISYTSRVLDIANQCDNTTKIRPGHINQPFHRRCLDENATTPQDSSTPIAGINVFDLNDAANQVTGEDIYTNTLTSGTANGYKNINYTGDLNVTRVNNVKFLALTVKDSNAKTVTILRMQSANIGSVDYYKRMF